MVDVHPRSRSNKLWICRSCRRGTLGEAACDYCSAPRAVDAPPTGPPPERAPRMVQASPVKERRVKPALLGALGAAVAVAVVVAIVASGLVSFHFHVSSAHPESVATGGSLAPKLDGHGDPVYVPPPRVPAPNRAIALPAPLTAPAGSGDVITPTAATAVVQAAWDLHHQALAIHDPSLMAAFETGPALEVDAGRCDCLVDSDPFGPLNQVAVFVPHQSSFPARFMAQVATTASDKPWNGFLVFTRADARSPWMLDLIGGYAGDEAGVAPPGVDGAGFLAPQTARPLVDPATVHALLADYWRFSKRSGKVPPAPLWDPGIWTNEFATKLTQYHQGGVAGNGLIGYYAYETDAARDGAYAFPQGQGWQIVCSPIRMQKTYLPTRPGERVVQDPAQKNWGPTVPPGAYSVVTATEIAVPCIEVPPAGSSQKVRVYGAQEYTDITTYK